MLNSQPLGFYSPSQLVQDAKRHGVEVRRVDVMHSDSDCTLEGLPHPPSVRLGLRLVAGLKAASAERIVAAQRAAPFDSADDLARRAALDQYEMTLLASADALMSPIRTTAPLKVVTSNIIVAAIGSPRRSSSRKRGQSGRQKRPNRR